MPPSSLLKSIGLLALLLSVSLFPNKEALAQQNDLSLTVSPISLDLTTTPGGTITDRVRVRNNSSRQLSLRVDVAKLIPTTAEPGLSIQEPAPTDEFVHWIRFDQPTFIARPNEWTDVPFTVTVPQHAAFGYYLAFVITPVQTAGGGEESNVVLSGSVAVLAALNVQAPGASAQAQLVEFKPKKFINEWLPADFTITVRNTGNIHIKPRGNIFIQRRDGSEVALLEVNAALSNILPNATRTFETSWSDGFLVREVVTKDGAIQRDQSGQPVTRLKIHWDKLSQFRFGQYTANLLMVFDNGERDVTLEGTTTFWVIPYKLLGGTLLGIVLLLFLLRLTLKAYVRRQVRRLQPSKR